MAGLGDREFPLEPLLGDPFTKRKFFQDILGQDRYEHFNGIIEKVESGNTSLSVSDLELLFNIIDTMLWRLYDVMVHEE
jgi:hypothetical protein